jgi:hypothetical protein
VFERKDKMACKGISEEKDVLQAEKMLNWRSLWISLIVEHERDTHLSP